MIDKYALCTKSDFVQIHFVVSDEWFERQQLSAMPRTVSQHQIAAKATLDRWDELVKSVEDLWEAEYQHNRLAFFAVLECAPMASGNLESLHGYPMQLKWNEFTHNYFGEGGWSIGYVLRQRCR